MDLGYDVIVTLTGIVLVFLNPCAADAHHQARGQAVRFDVRVKSAPKPAAKPAPKPAAKPAAPAAPAAAPVVEQGVPGEVVAAIMAAITAMGGGKYTLKAVRRGHNNWGRAGVNDTTAPF